ncbi:MAG: WG repeat-containing protein [Thermoguttaceae bacterium]|jgi:hypothetical protein
MIAIRPRFDDVSSFWNGRAGIVVEKKHGFIDTRGSVIVEPIYAYAHFFLGELAYVTFHPKQGDGAGLGYVNRSGQVVWKPRPK